jgi:hypothetical protein
MIVVIFEYYRYILESYVYVLTLLSEKGEDPDPKLMISDQNS